MDRSLWAIALAGVILLAPTVLAASGQGSFVIEDSLRIPRGSAVSGPLLGLFAEASPRLERIVVTAPEAHVYVVEQGRIVVAPHPDAFYVHREDATSREWNLTAFRMELLAPPRGFGWVGVYPDLATVKFTAGKTLDLTPSELSTLGDRGEPTGPLEGITSDVPESHRRSYQLSIPSDHLFAESPGAALVEGSGALKLYGGSVRVTSAEWNADIDTGNGVVQEGTVRREVSRWVYVEFPAGSVEIANGNATQLALADSDVAWSGFAAFKPVRGEITADGHSYVADERAPASLEGDFTASLLPGREAGRLVASMLVEGQLASTNLQPQTATLIPTVGGPTFSWLPILLFGAAVVGGSWGVAAVVARRRRPAPAARVASAASEFDDGMRADDCIRFADEAAVERRWTRALHWAQRARALAPGNARVRADEGEYLFQLGLFEESLQAFAAASELDPSEGYADYRGAQAAAAAGRPVDEVMAWLGRALQRSPDLVGDLELFKEFENLRGHPEYDAMVRDAYERLGIDPAPGF